MFKYSVLLFLLIVAQIEAENPSHLAKLLAKANIVVVAEVLGTDSLEKQVRVLKIIKGKIMRKRIKIRKKGRGGKSGELTYQEKRFFVANPKTKWLLFLSWYYGIILTRPKPAVFAIENDKDRERVKLLIRILPAIYNKRKKDKVYHLKKLLDSSNKTEEEIGIELLGFLDFKQYFEFFLKLMAHPKDIVRKKTTEYLEEMRSRELNKRLYKALEQTKENKLKQIILGILIKRKSKSLPKHLLRFLEYKDPKFRELALIGLRQANYTRALQNILLMVADPSPVVRKEAILTLQSFGLTKLSTKERVKIADYLLNAFQDDDPRVRVQALRAFPQIITRPRLRKRFYPLIESKLLSSDPKERKEAALTISKLEYLSVVTVFKLWLMFTFDSVKEARQAAASLSMSSTKNLLVSMLIYILLQSFLIFIAYLAERRKRIKLVFTYTLNKLIWGLVSGVGIGIVLSTWYTPLAKNNLILHVFFICPAICGFLYSFLCLVTIMLYRETGMPTYHWGFILGLGFFFTYIVFTPFTWRSIPLIIGFPFMSWFALRPYRFRKPRTRGIIAFLLGFVPFIFKGFGLAVVAAAISLIWIVVFKEQRLLVQDKNFLWY